MDPQSLDSKPVLEGKSSAREVCGAPWFKQKIIEALLQSRAVFFCFPAAILLLSFVGICWHTRTLWPWNAVVHEDGKRTLLETVFYFEHAAGELPLDTLLAAAVAGSALYFYPANRSIPVSDGKYPGSLLPMFAASTLIVIGVILGGALLAVGSRSLVDYLGQMYTRPGAALVWGSHWRYHLLERLATMLLGFSMTGCYRMFAEEFGRLPGRRGSSGLFVGALLVFGILTWLFGLHEDSFRNPIFLGHQARELLTHTLVTLPLAVGACLWIAGELVQAERRDSQVENRRLLISATGGCSVLIGIYLALGVILTGARSKGQSQSLAVLIFPHFFEHSFTYVITPLFAGALYLGFAAVYHRRKDAGAQPLQD